MPKQSTIARESVIHGTFCMVAGMLYGTQVGICPYPQYALGAHVQFMMAGVMAILLGVILGSDLCKLQDAPFMLWIIRSANWLQSVPSIFDAYYAFLGVGMPLLAERYNYVKPDIDDTFYRAMHFGPGSVLMLAWICALYGLLRTQDMVAKGTAKRA